MSGRKSKLTPLEMRTQLLVAESEINRACLREDMASLQTEAHSLLEKGRSAFSMVSTAAAAAAGLSAIGGIWGGRRDGKTSWISKLLKLARVGISLWSASRPRAP